LLLPGRHVAQLAVMKSVIFVNCRECSSSKVRRSLNGLQKAASFPISDSMSALQSARLHKHPAAPAAISQKLATIR
jgi:hypothetical protein